MRRILAVLFMATLLYLIYLPLKKENTHLIVYISIDQMRYDYLQRFSPHFSETGYNLLLKNGAVFTNSNYEHYCTYTAPGHAALGTSCYAAKSGIVGNDWYVRDTGESQYSVGDSDYISAEKNDTTDAGNKSPHNLLVSTLGDELKRFIPASKVFSVSSKDRAAILMAGKKADAAFWYNVKNGHYITSTFYMQTLPEWVDEFNRSGIVDSYFDKQWVKMLDESAFSNCTIDDYPAEDAPGGMGRTFPHPLNVGLEKPAYKYYKNLLRSPFGDEISLKFARRLIEEEDLGDDNTPDLLNISLSCTDYVGHAFGPDSHEMLEMQVRLDRLLQQFFLYLDKEIGLEKTIIILSADHGVAQLPEVAKERGKNAGRIQPSEIKPVAESHLRTVFGDPPAGMNWIVSSKNANIYINEKFWELEKGTPEALQAVLKEALEVVPGILKVIGRSELNSNSNDPLINSVRKAYNFDRGGEVVIIQKPNWIFNYREGSTTGTTHGSPHEYDTHVPMVIYGNMIETGTYNDPVGPADISVTIAEMLGINMSGDRDGRSLREKILKKEKIFTLK